MEAGYKQAVTARVGIVLLQYAAVYAVAERVKHLYTASGTSGEKYTENVLDKEGQIIATKGESASPQYDFYHYDIRNSVTNIVKSEGSTKVVPTQENEYDIFGKTDQPSTGTSKNEVKFTGALHEQQNGLYYMNARHYDPSTGRFLQQDVYKGEYGAPWTQNRYTYCGNNPVNMVDPSGHAFFTIAAITGAVVGGLFSLGSQLVQSKGDWSKVNKGKVFVAIASGAASAIPVVGSAISGFISGYGNEFFDSRQNNRSYDWTRATVNFALSSTLNTAYGSGVNNAFKNMDTSSMWNQAAAGIVSANTSFNAVAVDYATGKTIDKISQNKKSSYRKPVAKAKKKSSNYKKYVSKPTSSSNYKTNNYADTYKMYIPKAAGGYLPTPWDRIKSSRIWRG